MMSLPAEITAIMTTLTEGGFEAYAVGGCVRDTLLGRPIHDWDLTTNATPEQIQALFPDSLYENTFGTVTIKTRSEDPSVALVQVTPYRTEANYTDKRHPDTVTFATKLADDLSRRDFTMNALAMDIAGNITDLFGGQDDLRARRVRTVGTPHDRFGEDALRLLRAVRFAAQLGFDIEAETRLAIGQLAGSLRFISAERIRDEFVKIIESPRAYESVLELEVLGLLEHIMPELREGIGVGQNLHHVYTVWEHNLRALKYTVDKDYSLVVRLAALLHDVGKPRTKRGDGLHSTFYAHDVVGARMTSQIMERLKFSRDMTEDVTRLVRYHLFYYNVGEVTESSVRRLLANVGLDHIDDLLRVREADRIGSGTPKAVPYKLRHLKYIIDKVSHDPISVKMLKINGTQLMDVLGIEPGPKIGLVLNALLAEVLEDPTRNTAEYLERRARELASQSETELRAALQKIQAAVEAGEQERMKKYYV